MFDPLIKIETISINPLPRLNPEDKLFVEETYADMERRTSAELELACDLSNLEADDEIRNEWIDIFKTRLKRSWIENHKACTNSIMKYFQDKYSLQMYRNLGFKDEIPTTISKEELVAAIFSQVNWLAFGEVAEQEIIKDCRHLFESRDWIRDKDIQLSGQSIKFWAPFLRFSSIGTKNSSRWAIHCSFHKEANALFRALSHIENGSIKTLEDFWMCTQTTKYFDSEVWFSRCQFDLKRIKAIRFFKNERVQIWFDSNGTAERFKRVYMGR